MALVTGSAALSSACLRRRLAGQHLFDRAFDRLAGGGEDADQAALGDAVVGRHVQLVDGGLELRVLRRQSLSSCSS